MRATVHSVYCPKTATTPSLPETSGVFDVDHSKLDSRFFNHLSKSPEFVAACVSASDGTTNRRYLQEDAFLDMVVPTPDLTTQQDLVARLDALAENPAAQKRIWMPLSAMPSV